MGTGKGAMADSDVLLVGSLPYQTAEESFRAAGSALRGHAGWLPDGEPGPRQMWVGMMLELVFSKHPDIDETKAPPDHQIAESPEEGEGAESASGDGPGEELEGMWLFRVKPGRKIRFDDLKYGAFAKESYDVFRRLRDEGAVSPDVRFQMSVPSPHSSIDGCFDDPDQWPDLYDAYIAGIRGEIRKALETIPADDLVIQWDVALEFLDLFLGEKKWLRFWPKLTAEEKFQRHAAQLDELWQEIPDETLLGIHWCFGTWGGWPMADLPDLDLCVRMSNEAKRRFRRRLDYVHMPVVREPDEAFFAPLDQLDIGDTKLFLGMVHHTDGIEEFRRRRDLARKHASSFGIGSVCGYGRLHPDELPDVLRIHAADAAEL
jgi:hypothetical protein